MTSCLNRRFFGRNILESLGLSMEMKIQNSSMPRPHSGGEGILFKELRIMMIFG